jgi:hypothetical protein
METFSWWRKSTLYAYKPSMIFSATAPRPDNSKKRVAPSKPHARSIRPYRHCEITAKRPGRRPMIAKAFILMKENNRIGA